MRIVHVTTVHPVPDPRIFLKECASLAHAGHDVIVLACFPGKEMEQFGCRLLSVGFPSRDRWKRLFYQVRVWRFLQNLKPKVVHFHDPELLPLMLGLTFLDGQVRVVYDVHENYETTFGFPLTRWFYRRLFSWAERRMDLVLAEESYQTFCQRSWPVVKNLGLDYGSLPLESRRRRMVYLGDVAEERGALIMIRAFANAGLKEWDLMFVGKCNEAGLPAILEAESQRLGVRGRFHRLGYLPMEEAMAHVKESLLGLAILQPLPNHLGSLPTKVFDYLSAGVPVLLSDFPFYRRFFGNVPGVNFVDPTDVNAVTLALRDMVMRAEEWFFLADAGRRVFLKQFSWLTEKDKLLDIYSRYSPVTIGDCSRIPTLGEGR